MRSRVSANLFPMLGVQPELGRGFLEEEDHHGARSGGLLSDGLWRRRFHADPGVLGQKVILNDKPYEVIGVMPAGLKMPRLSQLQSMHIEDADPDIWKPLALTENELELMGDFNFGCIVRLRRGVSASRALDELNALEADIIRDLPEKMELRAKMSPLQQQMTGRSRKWSAVAALGGGSSAVDCLRQHRESDVGARDGTAGRVCDSRGDGRQPPDVCCGRC